jgi:hypothetical protein
MNKRFISLIVLIVLSLTFVFAANYTVTKQTITLEINADGEALISERFYVTFPTEKDKVTFRNISSSTGSNLDEWKTFDSRFAPHISSNGIVNGKIAYNEGTESYLEISYELPEPLMAKGKETSMVAEYAIKANYFNNYYQAGIWIIPDNTTMTIILPPGAEIKDSIEPPSVITTTGSRKYITWDGYKSANRFTVNYILWKKVSPVVDIGSIITLLFKTTQGQILILIAAILVILILWKKKFITDKIETFVEENSKIEEEQ